MKNFTIENETNNIMIHGSAKEAEAVPNSELGSPHWTRFELISVISITSSL